MRRRRAVMVGVTGAPFRAVHEVPIVCRVSFRVTRIRAGPGFHSFRALVIALVILVVTFGYHVTVLGPEKRSAKGLVDSAFWSTPRTGRSPPSSARVTRRT